MSFDDPDPTRLPSVTYAFGRTVELPFEEAEKRVREELAREGFGVLTEIDVRQKFQEKLQRDFRPYKILGACNPALAWEAFAAELNIGTLLPCNVVLYLADNGKTAVMVLDPVAALSLAGVASLADLALTARKSLQRVLSAL